MKWIAQHLQQQINTSRHHRPYNTMNDTSAESQCGVLKFQQQTCSATVIHNPHGTNLINKLGVGPRQLVVTGNLLRRWNSTGALLGDHHAQNGPREILLQLLQQRTTSISFGVTRLLFQSYYELGWIRQENLLDIQSRFFTGQTNSVKAMDRNTSIIVV